MAEAGGEGITLEGLIERAIGNVDAIRRSIVPLGKEENELSRDLATIRDMVRGIDVVFARMGETPIGTLTEADARLKLAATIEAVDLADGRTLERLNRAMRALKEAEGSLLEVAGEGIDRPWKARKAEAEGRAVPR